MGGGREKAKAGSRQGARRGGAAETTRLAPYTCQPFVLTYNEGFQRMPWPNSNRAWPGPGRGTLDASPAILGCRPAVSGQALRTMRRNGLPRRGERRGDPPSTVTEGVGWHGQEFCMDNAAMAAAAPATDGLEPIAQRAAPLCAPFSRRWPAQCAGPRPAAAAPVLSAALPQDCATYNYDRCNCVRGKPHLLQSRGCT